MKTVLIGLIIAAACVGQNVKVGRVPKAEADKLAEQYRNYLGAKAYYEILRDDAIRKYAPKDNYHYQFDFSEDFRVIVPQESKSPPSYGGLGWVNSPFIMSNVTSTSTPVVNGADTVVLKGDGTLAVMPSGAK